MMGGGARRTTCPGCGSTDRERLILFYLEDHFGINMKAGLKVLHVAPEKALAAYLRNLKTVEYLAGDKFMPGYTYPEDVIEIDLLALDCQDGVFDLIICNHVLEHIVDDRRAIREIHRVLKPTGTAILQVPLSKTTRKTEEDFEITDPEEREKLYGQPDHVRLYGLDYVDRLAECGFEVDILDIAADPKYNKAKLCKSEELYICSKS